MRTELDLYVTLKAAAQGEQMFDHFLPVKINLVKMVNDFLLRKISSDAKIGVSAGKTNRLDPIEIVYSRHTFLCITIYGHMRGVNKR